MYNIYIIYIRVCVSHSHSLYIDTHILSFLFYKCFPFSANVLVLNCAGEWVGTF